MKKSDFFIIVLLLFTPLIHLSGNERIEFSHLGIESGLSQITINGLYQDENGLMWIGTKDGIKRFNGNKVESFSSFGVNNWISSSLVPTVCGDKDGHVFFNSDYQIIEYDLITEKSTIIYKQNNILAPPSITFSYGLKSLWIALKDSIFNYKDKSLSYFRRLSSQKISISALKELSDGSLLVGTKNSGLICIDNSNIESCILNVESEIISIYEDSKKNVWIGTFNDGLFRIDKKGIITQFSQNNNDVKYIISSNYVRAICEDDNGNIWIGTIQGLDFINTKTSVINHYGLSGKEHTGLSNLSVWIIMKDNQGTIWFGTYYGGLDYYNPITDVFRYYDLGLRSGNSYPIISKIIEDKSGQLWIGTEGNGLVMFDKQTEHYQVYTKENSNIPHNNIKSLYYDKEFNKLWIGTHLGGFSCFDIKKRKFTNYTVDETNRTKRSEIVHSIVRHKDKIYLGTLAGIYYLTLSDNEINKLYSLDNYLSTVNALLLDKDNNLWVAGNNLCRYDIKNNKIKSFKDELSVLLSSEKFQLTSIFQNYKNQIIIASAGFGVLVYNNNKKKFKQYNKLNSGISNDYLSSISEMSNKYLLLGSSSGFSCLDLNNGVSYNFDTNSGFPLHSMMPGDIIKNMTGDFVMGGINGIAMFNEKKIFSKRLPIKIYFSKLLVNNQEVRLNDESNIINRSLTYADKISLKHNENNIAIEIGNNNFVNVGQAKYQYTLEGFNDEWIDFSPELPIQYMNLPYGTYKLKVRANLFHNQIKNHEIAIEIKVSPPWYSSWYAKLLYLILFLTIAGWILYFYQSRLMLRTSLELEHRDKLQKEKINESKMRFFANISHELRTPLTLIIGQLELLLNKNIAPAVQKNLTEIHIGASKMSKLINELLDFLKYNQGTLKLKVCKQDIIGFVKEECDTFSSYAKIKKINFNYFFPDGSINIYFDNVQMQKVISNLLSNAFKYTPKNGNINIRINEEETTVRIIIEDTGIGISDELKEKIFERFYQVDNEINNDLSYTGTGIGLSLAQNIVMAHCGTIEVESIPQKGSIFSVELKKGIEHFKQNNKIVIQAEVNDDKKVNDLPALNENKEFLDELIEQQKINFKNTPTLLIIEDDDEIRKMLAQIFDPLFHIFETNNGDDGFSKAKEISPDLILSDIMMPRMSGSKLCSMIKSDFETCHIPVVLLTALNSVEDNIIGLNCGADAYITKPFNVKLLVTECITILNNRRILQEKFSRTESISSSQITTNPLDQAFVDKAISIIEDNIEVGNIDVGTLCNNLAISRTKLFLKMKGITGQTPHEFIQNVKLKLAAKMLRENPEYNISDIAFNLGFSSLNYFGKSFKDFFGVSPSSYRKNSTTE